MAEIYSVTVTDSQEQITLVIPSGSGADMYKSVYDPNSVEGDAFDMDNMVEGTTNKLLKANAVTETMLAPKYKSSSVISALDVDWSASQVYTKTLSTNTTLTFSNLYVGVKSLIITGNFTLGFPTGFTLTTDSNAFDGTKVCLISVECWDVSSPVGLVHITYSA